MCKVRSWPRLDGRYNAGANITLPHAHAHTFRLKPQRNSRELELLFACKFDLSKDRNAPENDEYTGCVLEVVHLISTARSFMNKSATSNPRIQIARCGNGVRSHRGKNYTSATTKHKQRIAIDTRTNLVATGPKPLLTTDPYCTFRAAHMAYSRARRNAHAGGIIVFTIKASPSIEKCIIRDVRVPYVCERACVFARYDKIAAESAVANFRYRILFIVYEYICVCVCVCVDVPDLCGVFD